MLATKCTSVFSFNSCLFYLLFATFTATTMNLLFILSVHFNILLSADIDMYDQSVKCFMCVFLRFTQMLYFKIFKVALWFWELDELVVTFYSFCVQYFIGMSAASEGLNCSGVGVVCWSSLYSLTGLSVCWLNGLVARQVGPKREYEALPWHSREDTGCWEDKLNSFHGTKRRKSYF